MYKRQELELAKSIATYLSEQHYLCEFAPTLQDALDKIQLYQYDCILLDIGLPDGNGLKLLEELKTQRKQDGVIIISAKNALDDKIHGLQLGADDYLTKPFHLSELTARIYSLIRRKQFNSSNIVVQNEIQIDLLAKTVIVNDLPVVLTKKEFDLLMFFIGNKNKVISKSTLAEHLSGDIADTVSYTHLTLPTKRIV